MELSGTNAEYARLYNRRVVLEAIRVRGPISRAEIARLTSLMFQTVSTITREYSRQGIVREVGRRQSSRGQPATLLAFNTELAFTLGVHIDRNQIRVLLVDFAGTIRAQEGVWATHPGPDEAFAHVTRMTARVLADSGISGDRVVAAGVALPGPIQPDGATTAAPNFPGWEGVDLRSALEERLGWPVHLERDAIAAAMGERLHGDRLSVRNFAYVLCSGGIGAGLILNGQPHRGQWGHAGEIGHLLCTPLGGRFDGGHYRYLDELASLDRLFERLAIDPGAPDAMPRLEACVAAGDERITGWLDDTALYLMPVLIAVENILDIERIVIGGILPRPCVEGLVERLRTLSASVRMAGKRPYATLSAADSGENAAALGAAAMPVFEMLAPSPAQLLKRVNSRRLAPETIDLGL